MSSQLDSFRLHSDDTLEMEAHKRVRQQIGVLGEAQLSLERFPDQPESAWGTLQGAGIEDSVRVPLNDGTAVLNFINEERAKLRKQEVPVFNAVQAPYFTQNVA